MKKTTRQLLVLIAAIVVFLPSLSNQYIALDDKRIILKQDFLRSITLANLWTCWSPLPVREEFLPLRDMTYMLNLSISSAPIGIIGGNILIHALTSVAFLALAERLFRRKKGVALFAALLFAIHPIHIESVAWASGRKDCLSGLFSVLSLYFFLGYLRDTSARDYWLSLLCFLAGLASKATVVSLPGWLLLADYLFGGGERSRLRRHLPFVAGAVLFFVSYSWMLHTWGSLYRPVLKATPPDFASRLFFTDAVVISQYLRRLLLPLDQRFFSMQYLRASVDAEVLLGLLISGCALGGSAFLLAKRRRMAFGCVLFFLALVPCLNFVYSGILYAERYLYLASLGFCLFLAEAGSRLPRRIAISLSALYLGILAPITAWRTQIFRDDISLWSSVLADEPENTVALMNLASAYVDRDPDRAEDLYKKVLEINPGKATTYYNLGLIEHRRRNLDEALRLYRESARRMASFRKPWYGVAAVLAESGDIPGALKVYRKIAEKWPREAESCDRLRRSLKNGGAGWR